MEDFLEIGSKKLSSRLFVGTGKFPGNAVMRDALLASGTEVTTVARRMADCGAAAVMPLGSPIGSNRGVKTKELVRILIDEIKIPVIVDAGLGKPSDACECMEMGCEAVLVNTTIAIAENPVETARAFAGCGIVAECLDTAECKSALVSELLPLGKLLVAVSGLGGFGSSDEIRVHVLRENLVVIGDLRSDIAIKPALSPRVSIAAAKQAVVILSHVSGSVSRIRGSSMTE